ncbi:divergent polysaccharide deacetylase family protein [Temperatibacter marinus]|uniref:Divergent polysaccharide deacetylase family protein n=1 Tax=Temperatibacter marinus TaxID=1456591 RepID=A0AA52EFM4_9PROT|nr:divergent polysaccharide deacetylase family protein [Temperatibacter marinus]WND01439.1 divergent polysaccharide deacetylase family protein [Temperatibacter marinus]
MSSLRIILFAWVTSFLIFGGIYFWAEMSYDAEAVKNAEAASKEKPKPKLAVKAVSELLEEDEDGSLLPKIAEDGRRPFDVYAAEVQPSALNVPKVALVINRLGMRQRDITYAINELPKEVSLSFTPYASDLSRWAELAREQGHEVFIELPMEPLDPEKSDAGNLALTTGNSTADNMRNMRVVMSQMSGYVGIMSTHGSRFTSQRNAMRPIIDELKKRGLMYLDLKTTNYTQGPNLAATEQVPMAYRDIEIDNDKNPVEIRTKLRNLEERALTNGFALGVGSSKLVTMRQVSAWAKELRAKGILLVPVSAIASKQPL